MLPKDPIILLSYINSRLRDFYPSLDALCEDQEIEKQALIKTLSTVNYHYDQKQNRFR